MHLEIRALSDALGAEVRGLDLADPLDNDTFSAVHRAHLEHLVLLFRDQNFSPEQQIDFSRQFGPLDIHPADDATLPGHPEILLVSTRKQDGKYIGLPDAGPMWHSDISYKKQTALGSMLYAIEIPARGGATGFANMYAAYDTLPAPLKAALEGRRGVFLAGRNNAKHAFKKRLTDEQRAATPAVTHPIIRTHPETGRKSVFANPQHTTSIEGDDKAESDQILAELFKHCFQPQFVYHHDWTVGDLTFWDNRCVAHIADHSRLDDPGYVRHLHRTSIQGDVPV